MVLGQERSSPLIPDMQFSGLRWPRSGVSQSIHLETVNLFLAFMLNKVGSFSFLILRMLQLFTTCKSASRFALTLR